MQTLPARQCSNQLKPTAAALWAGALSHLIQQLRGQAATLCQSEQLSVHSRGGHNQHAGACGRGGGHRQRVPTGCVSVPRQSLPRRLALRSLAALAPPAHGLAGRREQLPLGAHPWERCRRASARPSAAGLAAGRPLHHPAPGSALAAAAARSARAPHPRSRAGCWQCCRCLWPQARPPRGRCSRRAMLPQLAPPVPPAGAPAPPAAAAGCSTRSSAARTRPPPPQRLRGWQDQHRCPAARAPGRRSCRNAPPRAAGSGPAGAAAAGSRSAAG